MFQDNDSKYLLKAAYMPLKMCSSMCSCGAARSWLATRQLHQLANYNNKAEKHLVARQYQSSSECSQNLFTQPAQKFWVRTPRLFEYNCFEFFKLSCETQDKLFVGTSLVFPQISHNVLVIHGKKIHETWSREKICPIHSSWHDYWCRESFGAVTQVIGQVFTLKWSSHVSMFFGWYADGCDIHQTLYP